MVFSFPKFQVFSFPKFQLTLRISVHYTHVQYICNKYNVHRHNSEVFYAKPIGVQMINDICLKVSQFPGSLGRGVRS